MPAPPKHARRGGVSAKSASPQRLSGEVAGGSVDFEHCYGRKLPPGTIAAPAGWPRNRKCLRLRAPSPRRQEFETLAFRRSWNLTPTCTFFEHQLREGRYGPWNSTLDVRCSYSDHHPSRPYLALGGHHDRRCGGAGRHGRCRRDDIGHIVGSYFRGRFRYCGGGTLRSSPWVPGLAYRPFHRGRTLVFPRPPSAS